MANEGTKKIEELIMQGNEQRQDNIWLQVDTLTVGTKENRHVFDLIKILKGLSILAESAIVSQEISTEENATDDIEEVKQEAKWQHNGQPDNPTTNE